MHVKLGIRMILRKHNDKDRWTEKKTIHKLIKRGCIQLLTRLDTMRLMESRSLKKGDARTDRGTYGRAHGDSNPPSYRDARPHLIKTQLTSGKASPLRKNEAYLFPG